MSKIVAITALLCALVIPVTTWAQSASCYDLWYERNLIYAKQGYCFATKLGKETFADYSCWTSNPSLTSAEKRQVAQIKAEERSRKCRVNE